MTASSEDTRIHLLVLAYMKEKNDTDFSLYLADGYGRMAATSAPHPDWDGMSESALQRFFFCLPFNG
jgi:hypothetical protein